MDWILLLTVLGVAAAWTPFLIERFTPIKIKGKIISQYDNAGTFANESKAIFLFKLSIVSLNQSFDLKDIDVNIKYQKNGWTKNKSVNQRSTYFTLENQLKKLNVPESSFLNNISYLKKDEPVVGYLLTTSPFLPNDQITEIEFIFESFRGKRESLLFKSEESNSLKMLYDDSIWVKVDSITTDTH